MTEETPPPFELSPTESRDDVVRTNRYRAATGWAPKVPLLIGLDRTLDFQLNKGNFGST